MNLLSFLTTVQVSVPLSQKAIVILILLCFIPVSFFVFLPKTLTTSRELEMQYFQIRKQMHKGYYIALNQSSNCGTAMLGLATHYCMVRCQIKVNCSVSSNSSCKWTGSSYVSNGLTYCTALNLPFQNNIISSNGSATMNLNSKITYDPSTKSNIVRYYLFTGNESCYQITNHFGHSISEYSKQSFQRPIMTLRYLLYLGLLPLVAIVLVLIIINNCTSFNFRFTISLFATNICIVSCGIIVIGINFNNNNNQTVAMVNQFGNDCIVNSTIQAANAQSLFINFYQQDGITEGFAYFMGFLLVLQLLGVVAIIVINIIIRRLMIRTEEDINNSGYELQNI